MFLKFVVYVIEYLIIFRNSDVNSRVRIAQEENNFTLEIVAIRKI